MAGITVEIWSDIVCPFCYIGKRKFETALEQFPQKHTVKVIWKSFLLSPGGVTNPTKNLNRFLAEHKGISEDEAKKLNEYVTQMAATAGLVYNMDKVIVANSLKAHRLLHFTKTTGKQNITKEVLFRSYFTDGKNIDDDSTLLQVIEPLGFPKEEISAILSGDRFLIDVERDVYEARQIGIRGVPFFLFNGSLAVSGAQSSEVFLNALNNVVNRE